ncbi:MAG TPA: hypothetical protein VFT66_20080 [Roseiflexaceae bacterium]|jgi:hypothetical protein|nr:hypothetical protein [Roseiflexaceae bacterium]
MAVNTRHRITIRQAKAQRVQLPRYLRLDRGRYLIAAALLLAMMSLLTLGQTGRLATKGYEISQLQQQRDELIRNRSAMQIQLAEAQTIEKLKKRAVEQGLRPVDFDQVRYLTVQPISAAASSDATHAATTEDHTTQAPVNAPDATQPADQPQP